MDGLRAVGLSGLYIKYSIKVDAENKTYVSSITSQGTVLKRTCWKILYVSFSSLFSSSFKHHFKFRCHQSEETLRIPEKDCYGELYANQQVFGILIRNRIRIH